MSEIKHIKADEFKSTIEQGVVLVDFFADWCGPCKMIAPVLEEIAVEVANKAKIVKVDIDKDVEIASEFQITAVPTFILFKDGKEEERFSGVRDKEQIKNVIEKAL